MESSSFSTSSAQPKPAEIGQTTKAVQTKLLTTAPDGGSEHSIEKGSESKMGKPVNYGAYFVVFFSGLTSVSFGFLSLFLFIALRRTRRVSMSTTASTTPPY
ncbi:unnamed protein product [Cylicocyclus nassatus]|uniref:Uncharacterized protein n=1 Tax=Cylicocyclus nassatus TaxID=53992 RepID=A0AA36GDX9_CYLNA|nr:unnamed protein product [Cylicocyclus nassatus]